MLIIRLLAALALLLAIPFPLPYICAAGQSLPHIEEQAGTESTGRAVDQAESPAPQPVIPSVIVPLLDFDQVPIQDAIAALFRPFGVNVWVSPDVGGAITVYLADVQLGDAFQLLIKEGKLRYSYEDNIIKVYPVEEAQLYDTEVSFADGLLSLNFRAVPLRVGIAKIVEAARFNIVTDQGLSGTLTGILAQVPFSPGLEALLSSNGFAVEFRDSIAYVTRFEDSSAPRRYAAYEVGCDSGAITLDVRNADLQRLVEDIALKCGLQIVLYGTLTGNVTIKCVQTSIEDVLTLLFRGTQYTFKHERDIYQFGSAQLEEMRTSRLIRLNHMVADDLIKIIPASISTKIAVTIVQGQNGFIATGPFGTIKELEQFVESFDRPQAQVLIEALVVDFSTDYLREFSIIANNTGKAALDASSERYYPEIQLNTTGKAADKSLQDIAGRLGVSNIGHLSDDFYVRLRALSQEGKANIRSRPIIAALNGHEASISIGTTQYYLLKSETIYTGSSSTPTSQVSQRFETIKADISLKVTPWVTATGEIIVDIAPEFNTPQGQFDPDIPPTINHRTLHSTVRLLDGETIVLGGLVQSSEHTRIEKVPLLGEIPILGRIFQNRISTSVEAELMIFLTPKVYYGPEAAIDITDYERR